MERVPITLWHVFNSPPPPLCGCSVLPGQGGAPFLSSLSSSKETDNIRIPHACNRRQKIHRTVAVLVNFKQHHIKQLTPLLFMHSQANPSLNVFLRENQTWTVWVLNYVSAFRMHPLHKLWIRCTCFDSARVQNINRTRRKKTEMWKLQATFSIRIKESQND